MVYVLRLTVVLCKEISLLSKKFTSCLTTAGVSVMIPTYSRSVAQFASELTMTDYDRLT